MKRLFMALGLWICTTAPVTAEERWTDMAALEENVRKGDYGTVTSILIMEGGQAISMVPTLTACTIQGRSRKPSPGWRLNT